MDRGQEIRELKLGASFTNPNARTAFHTLKCKSLFTENNPNILISLLPHFNFFFRRLCSIQLITDDFKPASVDVHKEATLQTGSNNSVTVTLPHLGKNLKLLIIPICFTMSGLVQMDLGFRTQLSRVTSETTRRRSASWSSTVIRMRYFWRSCIATFKWKRQEPTRAANLRHRHPQPQPRRRRPSRSTQLSPLLLVLQVLLARLRTRRLATAQRHASQPAWGRTTFWISCQNIRLCKVLLPTRTGVLNKRHCKLSRHSIWQATRLLNISITYSNRKSQQMEC